MIESAETFAARMEAQKALLTRKHDDGAMLVKVEGRARCVECGTWLTEGWSFMLRPVDGNYVECDPCRYGAGS